MLKIRYTTATQQTYTLQADCAIVSTDAFVVDRRVTEQACYTGCSNFGKAGGCPPKAPHFPDLCKQYKSAFVMYVLMRYEEVPEKLKKIPQWLMSLMFQDALMARLINRVVYDMKARTDSVLDLKTLPRCSDCNGGVCHHRDTPTTCGGGSMILAQGHCMGCGRCSFKKGSTQCNKPARRTFSMEATGVRVDKLMKLAFGLDTYWYKTGYKPPYLYKAVSLLIPRLCTAFETLQDQFIESLSSVKSVQSVTMEV